MQINVFNNNAAWQYYVYTSLVLVFIVFSSYALLRSRRRFTHLLRSLAFRLLMKLIESLPDSDKEKVKEGSSGTYSEDLEKQALSTKDEIPTVLK